MAIARFDSMVLEGQHACVCIARTNWFDLWSAIKSDPWSLSLKYQLLNALSPYVKFGPPWRPLNILGESELDDQIEEHSVSHLVEADVKLRVGDLSDTLIDDLKTLDNHDEIFIDIADGLTGHLIETWDLFAALGKADEIHDYSYISQPSISEHEQNRGYKDWVMLLELVRASWLNLVSQDPLKAKALVARWRTIRYPVFRRLTMFAMADFSLFGPEEALNFLLSNDGWWLWSVETQRETYRLLSAIWLRLSEDEATRQPV